MEPAVTVKVRKQDEDLVREVLPNCAKEYKASIGRDVNLAIDPEGYLPPDTCGGIELQSQKGRIKISSTLEARLELIAQKLVPQIRQVLFGANVNRKFFD